MSQSIPPTYQASQAQYNQPPPYYEEIDSAPEVPVSVMSEAEVIAEELDIEAWMEEQGLYDDDDSSDDDSDDEEIVDPEDDSSDDEEIVDPEDDSSDDEE